MIRLLIDHGADVNARTEDGLTPLAAAKRMLFHEDTVALLVSAGAHDTEAPKPRPKRLRRR